ncbi:hypothetical protein [Neobacillus sp. CF12]|uniref:hypothetical protein n=1 Tax=Neobacillus sp. CF12 TaxID=3055864 RepID=UPI0025A29CDA|nr:hypothetical protein [Neobacillus sp. CF12]MDM5326778.1 hypothetical protein [Neobacillus sp. CF12]
MRIIIIPLIGILTICMLVGCGAKDIEPQQVVKQNVKEVEPRVEEPKIKKEQYDVVWGSYDNEWVYSDEWTGEGFENFDEAMNVLDQCMKDTERETEKCVYNYLNNK